MDPGRDARMNSEANPSLPPADTLASPPPPPQGTATLSAEERDVRLWTTACHLAALAGLLLPSFGAVLGPLVVWLLKRHDHPRIDQQGKEALNFQLSILVYSWVLGLVGVATLIILVGFLFLGLAAVAGIVGLILAIWAAIKASQGESYRYPLTIRFLQ
jgi:uncharacterized Tic20 family protein